MAKTYGEKAKSIVESFNILSEDEYEALETKDNDKIYFVYES